MLVLPLVPVIATFSLIEFLLTIEAISENNFLTFVVLIKTVFLTLIFFFEFLDRIIAIFLYLRILVKKPNGFFLAIF